MKNRSDLIILLKMKLNLYKTFNLKKTNFNFIMIKFGRLRENILIKKIYR
jgi:hypothetical protein